MTTQLRMELEPAIGGARMGEMIPHPFCVMPYDDSAFTTKRANALFLFNKDQARKAFETGSWATYVMAAHARGYRVSAFQTIPEDRITDEGYWNLLSEVWLD